MHWCRISPILLLPPGRSDRVASAGPRSWSTLDRGTPALRLVPVAPFAATSRAHTTAPRRFRVPAAELGSQGYLRGLRETARVAAEHPLAKTLFGLRSIASDCQIRRIRSQSSRTSPVFPAKGKTQ